MSDSREVKEEDQLYRALLAQAQAQGRSCCDVSRDAGFSRNLLSSCRDKGQRCLRQDTWVLFAQALGCRWTLIPDTRCVRIKADHGLFRAI